MLKKSAETAFEYEDTLSMGSVIKAAYLGNVPQLKDLIRNGCAANVNDNRGYTALHIAVVNKQ